MMNFKEISFRMFKSNIRRYILYILCSAFTTMIVFLYLTIYTNKDFNDSSKVNDLISSNLYAPSLVLAIFSVCFIIYAHNYFMKFRNNDFAIFMIIGMTDNDIRKILILENTLISSTSILTGLIIGTLFSKIFYFIVMKIIDINIHFGVNLKIYLYTLVFFAAINVIVILKSCIVVSRYKIINLLKDERIADRNFIGKVSFRVLGIILIFISIFTPLLLIYNKKSSSLIFISIVAFLLGIYLMIANLDFFVTKLFKKKYFNNLLFISNLKYTIGSCKNIIFSIVLLVASVIYFISFSSTCSKVLKKNSITYNPYDISYVEIFGKNILSQNDIHNILKSSDAKVSSIKNIEFIMNSTVTILSDKVLNQSLESNLHVDEGKYISLFQVDRNDGYNHDTTEIKDYIINNTTYISQGKLEKILFNSNPLIGNSHYLIFNNNDYIKIKSSKALDIGNIKLINFNNWTKTDNVINHLINKLELYNKTSTKRFFDNANEDIKRFKPTGKISDYILAKQASSFLLFLFCFIFTLFFISSNLMVHFKLLTEYEKQKIKYDKLYKMGISEKHITKNILKELKVLFLLPCILGVIVGTYFVYFTLLTTNIETRYGFKCALISSGTYMLFQGIFYLVYKKLYIRNILRIYE
ncbi:FtsX-like permease family protein [Clostridium botulinum]|uniref:FtsX-like permease family protein n=1 Tax=Clostridium botulinum TaxID=1491 RepID=UPI001FA90979|nr:FtsX-like permease family protein [Clostridium botulinum]